ncbi:hypothetical protein ACQPUZ_11725 [Clostridium tertium]
MIKVENSMLENLTDCFFCIMKKNIFWIGICSSLQQIMIGLFSEPIYRFTILKNEYDITNLIYFLVFLGGIYIIIETIYEFFKKEFVIKVIHENEENKIIIKIGSYEDNMDEILNKIKFTNKQAIFIVGINDKVNMSIAERKGVHKAVLDKFYTNEEQCSILQEKVDKSFEKTDEFYGKFGGIGLIEHNDNSRIMFVINSKYEAEQSTSIIGPQPTDIIIKVFEKLEKESVEIVQIPILSSINVKGISNSIKYSITIAEIIEQYFKEILNPNNINYDLVLSIRKEDLKKKSITIKYIINFINNIKYMYHIK